jgi:small GTP-binding protein
MAVNLPPHYHDAEERYKKAKAPAEKLAALREMWVILPKHKASEKVQMQLKTKISELNDLLEAEASGPKKSAPGSVKIPRQGAGQVVFVGPPNAGKSLLLGKLTKASPTVAAYPFTTRDATPGMMEFEDVRVQLIDLPPITSDSFEPFHSDLTRGADAAILFLDLADDDGAAATLAVIERLQKARRLLVPSRANDDDPTIYQLPTILVGNKCDDEAADIRLEMAREAFGDRFPIRLISSERGDGLPELRRVIFDALGVMRIYTRQPGKAAEMTAPFTCPIGSTVAEFAGCVHSDFEEKVKAAKVWGSAQFDGQTVGREHVLREGDVVELMI